MIIRPTMMTITVQDILLSSEMRFKDYTEISLLYDISEMRYTTQKDLLSNLFKIIRSFSSALHASTTFSKLSTVTFKGFIEIQNIWYLWL